MHFRLEKGQMVTVDDRCLDLCQLFTQFQTQAHVLTTLDELLRESPFRKIRTDFIEMVKKVWQATMSSSSSSSSAVVAVPLMDEDHVRQLGNPDSVFSQALKREAAQNEQTLGCLDFVHVNVDRLLAPIVHRVRFLKDKTLLAVSEYLQLSSPRRSNTMFDTLPASYQGSDPHANFRTLVHASLHPYVAFVEALDDDMLMEMARAAVQLGIPSLVHLLGCRMAQLVNTLGEREIRQRFGMLDDKFAEAIKEKLDQILAQQAWLSDAPFTSSSSSGAVLTVAAAPAVVLPEPPTVVPEATQAGSSSAATTAGGPSI